MCIRDSANTDYNAAIALVQDKSRQDDAMVAFQNFIKNYHDSTYLPNANYWLGQLNYNKGKKDDAAYYFASVVKDVYKRQEMVSFSELVLNPVAQVKFVHTVASGYVTGAMFILGISAVSYTHLLLRESGG